MDYWENMPLGKLPISPGNNASDNNQQQHRVISSDSEVDHPDEQGSDDASENFIEAR